MVTVTPHCVEAVSYLGQLGRFFYSQKQTSMAINKQKKADIISDLEGIIAKAKTFVFVNFSKLSVHDANALRRQLQKEGIGYKVAKKTLIKRALGDKFEGELPALEGQIGLAYGEDLLAPAREIYNFHKTHKDVLSIAGGIFEGKYVDQPSMLAIATIPGREVLLSQLAFLLKSPMQKIAVAVNEVAKSKA